MTARHRWPCPKCRLLAVLPGTGGLTRVTDKRKVRRDLADVFCSIEEGVKGKRAVDWRLVDEVVAEFEVRRDRGGTRPRIRRRLDQAGRGQRHRADPVERAALPMTDR